MIVSAEITTLEEIFFLLKAKVMPRKVTHSRGRNLHYEAN